MAHLTGSIVFPHPTSGSVVASSSAPPLVPFGTEAADAAGNRYLYVDFGQALAIGELCGINESWLATELLTTSRGRVGVVVSTISSSDYGGWVQVFGTCDKLLAASNTLTTALGVAPSTSTTDGYAVGVVGTSDQEANIQGLTVVSTSTSGTSPTSAHRYSRCVLNYPWYQNPTSTGV